MERLASRDLSFGSTNVKKKCETIEFILNQFSLPNHHAFNEYKRSLVAAMYILFTDRKQKLWYKTIKLLQQIVITNPKIDEQ